jgi:hypothetical protein
MKKIILIIMMLFVISGCSTEVKDVDYTLDINTFYQECLTQDFFDEPLNEVLNSNLDNIFGEIEFVEAKVGTNTGANANMLAIFKTDDLKSLEKIVGYYLEDTEQKYESYQPEEVLKIKNATIAIKGSYLILIISDNYDYVETYVNDYLAS